MPVPAYVPEVSFAPRFCISYVCVAQICSRIAAVISEQGKSLAPVFRNSIVVILIQRGIQSNRDHLELWLRYIAKEGNRQTFVHHLVPARLTSNAAVTPFNTHIKILTGCACS
jgi:hypothetical protein